MSKSRCSLPKNVRLQVIVGMLEVLARDQGLSTAEIFQMISEKGIAVSLRTILRDLNELSLYMPITEEERNGTLYWIWSGDVEKLTSLDRIWREQFLEYSKDREAS